MDPGRASREPHLREKLRREGTKAKEFCICCDVTSLRGWQPCDSLSFAVWLGRVEDAELDGRNVCGIGRG